MITKSSLFEVKYDWGLGDWRVEIRSLSGMLIAYKGFQSEADADAEVPKIRAQLVDAPGGDPVAVLIDWADWSWQGLEEERKKRCRREG